MEPRCSVRVEIRAGRTVIRDHERIMPASRRKSNPQRTKTPSSASLAGDGTDTRLKNVEPGVRSRCLRFRAAAYLAPKGPIGRTVRP